MLEKSYQVYLIVFNAGKCIYISHFGRHHHNEITALTNSSSAAHSISGERTAELTVAILYVKPYGRKCTDVFRNRAVNGKVRYVSPWLRALSEKERPERRVEPPQRRIIRMERVTLFIILQREYFPVFVV